MIWKHLVLILLVISGTYSSVRSSDIVAAPPYEVVVAGQHGEGRLKPYRHILSGWEWPKLEDRTSDDAVFLREYLWFPNPLSSSSVIVGVMEQASFSISIVDATHHQIDQYEFNDVDVGVYFFDVLDPVMPLQRCTVHLKWNDHDAGMVKARTNRGKLNSIDSTR